METYWIMGSVIVCILVCWRVYVNRIWANKKKSKRVRPCPLCGDNLNIRNSGFYCKNEENCGYHTHIFVTIPEGKFDQI